MTCAKRKRALALFTVFLMLLTMLVPGIPSTQVSAATALVATSSSDLAAKVSGATDDTTITLDASFPLALTAALNLTNTTGHPVTIDGEGKTLQVNGNFRHMKLTTNPGSKIILKDFILSGNTSTDGGGAIINANSAVIFDNCVFQNNMAGIGAAIEISGKAIVQIFSSTFLNNTGYAGGYNGGAIALNQAQNVTLDIQNSYFKKNQFTANGTGGAIGAYLCMGSAIKVDNSVFENNACPYSSDKSDGGAIAIKNNGTNGAETTYTITNSTFINNKTMDDAGAILIEGGTASLSSNPHKVTGMISNCTFFGNTGAGFDSTNNGGAVQVFGLGATANVWSCTFYGNQITSNTSSTTYGGALSASGSWRGSAAVNTANCLFVDNKSNNTKYMNVYGGTDKGGNIGFDKGSTITYPIATDVFGTATPVLADNGAAILAGSNLLSGNSQTTVKTLLIAPNLGEAGKTYADNAASLNTSTGADAIAVDQRGKDRGTSVRDSGSVEILSTIFDANGGNWASPAFTYSYTSPVIYNSTSGATLCGTAQDYPAENTTAIPAPDTALATKSFVEWNTDASGSGTAYAAGATIPAGSRYYAIWAATYSVTYHVNTGDTGTDYTDANLPAGSYTLLVNGTDANLGFAKTGYTFLGWDRNPGANTPAYTGGQAITLSGSLDLYAIWQQNPAVTYSVTYHVNTGDTGTDYTDANLPAGSYTLLVNGTDANLGFAKTGYTFLGWDTNPGANTPTYTDGQAIPLSGNLDLYAIWQEDIDPAHLHYAYIIGYPDGTVRPNRNISREEVSSVLVRILEETVLKSNWVTTNNFPDVSDKRWSNNTISTMEALGNVIGYPDGNYRPSSFITREEFATIIVRMKGLENATPTGGNYFSDVNEKSWSARYINLAYEHDLVIGRTATTFEPKEKITRAEAMAIVNRLLSRRVKDKSDLLTSMQTFSDNSDTTAWYYLDVQEATNSHFCVPGIVENGLQYEKWTALCGTPQWILLAQQNFNIQSLVYPKS